MAQPQKRDSPSGGVSQKEGDRDLLAEGLVDEMHLMIGAGVVADGIPAFEARPQSSLRLLDARTFDASSLLLARYRVEG